MKKLLLYLILINQVFGITIKLIDETDTSNIDLNAIYNNYSNGVIEVEEKHVGSVATFDVNDKSSNKFFIGATYGINLSSSSILKNSEEERIGNYVAQPKGVNLGISMKSVDLYLNYNQIGIASDNIADNSYVVYGAGFKYKMMLTQALYPFIAIETGYANTQDNNGNQVAGLSVLAGGGIGLDIAILSLKVSYAYSNILWDYPVVGVTNSFTEQSIIADASIKF